MRTPNLNALKMFDAAARHLNFRLAAEEMSLTQGAVAQQVRKLEADLGHQLFRRNARGLSLTPIGHGYHGPIRRALELIEDATRQLAPDPSGVTLSVPPSFASKWLVPRLRSFEQAHPDIALNIAAEETLTTFRTDAVQIAVRQGAAPANPDLSAALLSLLDLRAVAGAGFVESIEPIKDVAQLGNHTLIQDGHRHWDALINAGQINPKHRILQFNQTGLAMDAARNGQGIALVPRLFLEGTPDQHGLVPLWSFAQADDTGFYVVWPRADKISPPVQQVRDWLLSQVPR